MNLVDLLVFAADLTEAHEKTFSLFDFSNNVINWFVLVGFVVWIWYKVTPSMFKARHDNIEGEINEARQARLDGEKFLVDQQTRVANAEAEATTILTEAKHLASELKSQVQEQTTKEIADMRVKMESAITNERQMAVSEMRMAAAKASVQLTKEILPSLMSENVKSKLLTQFIDQLDESARQGIWESKN